MTERINNERYVSSWIGQQISSFKILEVIGSGGMGIVYRGVDMRSRHPVAIKLPWPEVLSMPGAGRRLVREAVTISGLEHRNIVSVYDVAFAGDIVFMVMEYIVGRSLNQVIGNRGFDLDQVIRYATQIAEALACAHEHGIVHRDLKPQNVMLTATDEVKLLDFGLAKQIRPARVGRHGNGDKAGSATDISDTITGLDTLVGTPGYMSPEQADGEPVDQRSDVFSLGCLLYKMLIGRSPFRRKSKLRSLCAVLCEQPEPLLSVRPELPEGIERIVARALAKDPVDRYQSMDAILAALRKLRADLEGRYRDAILPLQELGSGNSPPCRAL